MSKFLRKKLHLCFSSSGGLSPSIPSSPVVVSNHNPPSHHHPSILINNFNSLYDHLSVSSPLRRVHRSDNFNSSAALITPTSGNIGSDNPSGQHPSPCRADEDNEHTAVSKLLSDGMVITKHIDSRDPYRDFGRSMREMVEARDLTRDLREYLHDLLFCYLSLNPQHTHKFIVSAFADTLLWLLSPSSEN